MGTKQFRLLWVVLISLSGVLPAAATDYQASDYLPLAVGNSWTYEHIYHDYKDRELSQWPAYTAQFPEEPQFTIRVERTEVIDGKTYYVLSDMPTNWPPAPPHFIAGKKLRWEGTHLMERTADGEQAIYRFDGTSEDYTPISDSRYGEIHIYETEYAISTEEGDSQVEVRAYLESPLYSFKFLGIEGEPACGFLAGYGPTGCSKTIFGTDHPLFRNRVRALRAVIRGTPVEIEEARRPTASQSSSWGQVKQSLMVQASEGRTN